MGSLVLFPKIQAIEDENAGHPQILVDLQFPLDVVLQREGETTQGDQERFAGRVVEEVLGDVVRGIDTDDGAFEGRERERLDAGRGPFV